MSQALLEDYPKFLGVLNQVIADHDLEDLVPNSCGQRVVYMRPVEAVVPLSADPVDPSAGNHSIQGQIVAERLAQRQDVGYDPFALDRHDIPASSDAGLHLVDDEEHAPLPRSGA
ncbi:hypothetical protein DL769_006548 [Monosporascus sp. CRB-8-3]|nr:hypothetical protein DL769_006548 [Monosporascus sp. CRB-8-3]